MMHNLIVLFKWQIRFFFSESGRFENLLNRKILTEPCVRHTLDLDLVFVDCKHRAIEISDCKL